MTFEKEVFSTPIHRFYLRMTGLSEDAKTHLEQALQAEDSSEKDFHIRNVLQAHVDTDVDLDD